MFDRHATNSPEEQLDRWLDALNDPAHPAPLPPDGISAIAGIARRYRDVLGTSPAHAAAHSTIPERNGHMHAALPLPTSTNGTSWKVTPPVRRHRSRSRAAGWLGWLSTSLSTAVVIGLILAMGGAMIYQQNGLPGNSDDPASAPGFAASPEATPADGLLSCASPGYRAVVEGDVNQATLAMIGESEAPLNIDGAHINIPNSNDETVTLASTWTSIGGPMWSSETSPDASGNATIRNVETGEEWTFPDAGTYFPGLYVTPYLIVPASGDATDFRIIDTESNEEVLVSELHDGRFHAPMRISTIAIDYNSAEWPRTVPLVLLFTPEEIGAYRDPGDVDTLAESPNALYLPVNLDDARFIPDHVDASYFHETAYSDTANRLAFATKIGDGHFIVVTQPDGNDRMVIQHPEFTAQTRPLMFSENGNLLVVSQPGELITLDLQAGPRSVPLSHKSDEPFMPIAHNAASMNVLMQYPDNHIAIINAATGDVTELPGITVPKPEFAQTEPIRLSFENDTYELFDDSTSTVRLVDLTTANVSDAISVLNPDADSISAAVQPEFQYSVRYPYASWNGAFAYLDPAGALQVRSTNPGGETWSIPAPDGFEIGKNEVPHIFVNPTKNCVALEIATSTDFDLATAGIAAPPRSKRIATWIAPLEPGAEWTKLDTHITGWFHMTNESAPETLPAQEIATLTPFTPDLQTADGYSINLRANPSTQSRIVITLAPGTPLMAILEDGERITRENEFDPQEIWVNVGTESGDVGWIREIDLKPYEDNLPAPIATPQASPAASAALSCASPGYRAVVKGDVDTRDLAMIGTTAEPIILNNGDVTITAANGTDITFAEGENFYRTGNVVLTGGDKGEPTTVTSLVTGESWTLPPADQSPNQFSTGTLLIAPWLIGAIDESQTEWRIINTTTGEERLTSDLFGDPLDHISQPDVPGPWAYNASPSAIFHFVPEGTGDGDTLSPVVVLPTANPDDAYALDDIHASAGWTGAITSDGSRIAYVTEDAFRVLDGFTGELISQYPLPKSAAFYEPVGLTADDSKLILEFNQQLWTVDLTTGDIVSIFDPGAQIRSINLDQTTGTMLASAGDRGQPSLFWIDPLSAEAKPLAAPQPIRPPQPQFGWALLQTQEVDQFGVGYSLLDMTTGEIATTTEVASGDDNGTNVIIIGGGGEPAGIYVVRAEPDSLVVLDGPGGQSFELPIPDGARQQTSSVAIGFSPNSACLYYTEVALPGEEDGGTTWVAPLAPGAEWTQLPFELAGFWAPVEPAPEATPGT